MIVEERKSQEETKYKSTVTKETTKEVRQVTKIESAFPSVKKIE